MILCDDEDFKDPEYISQFERNSDIIRESVDFYFHRPLLLSERITSNKVDLVNYHFYKYEIPLRVYYDNDIKRLYLASAFGLVHEYNFTATVNCDKVEIVKKLIDYLSVYDEIYIEEKHHELHVNTKCKIENPLTGEEINLVANTFNVKLDKTSSYGTAYGDGFRYLFKFENIDQYDLTFIKILGNTFINYEVILSGPTYFSFKEKDISLNDFLEKVKTNISEVLIKDYNKLKDENTVRVDLLNLLK